MRIFLDYLFIEMYLNLPYLNIIVSYKLSYAGWRIVVEATMASPMNFVKLKQFFKT